MAAKAQMEAENAGESQTAFDVEDLAVALGGDAIAHLKKMLRSKNPADIPGGNMSGCIAIMEARPDVDNAGALCNWLARRAGEYGGIRTGLGAKKKKLKPGQRGLLRKAMRL